MTKVCTGEKPGEAFLLHRDPFSDCLTVCVLQFDKIFEPYTKYCLEQDICREYIKTKTMENELFRTFVTVSKTVSLLLTYM